MPSSSTSPAAIGFNCTLFVGDVIINADGEMEAGTEQTCTGAFSEKFTRARFARKNLIFVWVMYSSAADSDHTSDAIDDVTWTIGCHVGGVWDYRLEATPYARSSEDGNLVSGPIVFGVPGTHPCGT